MQRRTGIAAVAAAAAIGVGAAFLANAMSVGPPSTAGSTKNGTTSPPSTPARTSATTPPPSTSPPSTSPPSATSPASTAPKPVDPARTPTKPVDPGPTQGLVGDINLLQLDDFARAGWNTDRLEVNQGPGEGQDVAMICQAAALSSFLDAGAPFRGDYNGATTSATDVVVTFDSAKAANAAHEGIVQWFSGCGKGPGSDTDPDRPSAGEAVDVNLDSSTDTATYWRTSTASGASGAGGVVVVGRRIAIVQIRDKDPKALTLNSLFAATAKRLSAE